MELYDLKIWKQKLEHNAKVADRLATTSGHNV